MTYPTNESTAMAATLFICQQSEKMKKGVWCMRNLVPAAVTNLKAKGRCAVLDCSMFTPALIASGATWYEVWKELYLLVGEP